MIKVEEPAINMLVGRKKIEWVAFTIQCSEHFKMQELKRSSVIKSLRDRILNCVLAWKTYDNNICIAFNSYEYIVVDPNKIIDGKQTPIGVTYVNLKKTGGTVIDKLLMTYREFLNGDEKL